MMIVLKKELEQKQAASEGSSSGTELNYSVSLPENPKRANRILNNLS